GGGPARGLRVRRPRARRLDGARPRARRRHGGRVPPDAGRTRSAAETRPHDAAGAWRKSFLDAPYLRDALVAMGMISETFETAVTWDRFAAFHEGVTAATEEALRRVCDAGQLTCRFTHVYPDGPAPYYTVIAPGPRGGEPHQRAATSAGPRARAAVGGTPRPTRRA